MGVLAQGIFPLIWPVTGAAVDGNLHVRPYVLHPYFFCRCCGDYRDGKDQPRKRRGGWTIVRAGFVVRAFGFRRKAR